MVTNLVTGTAFTSADLPTTATRQASVADPAAIRRAPPAASAAISSVRRSHDVVLRTTKDPAARFRRPSRTRRLHDVVTTHRPWLRVFYADHQHAFFYYFLVSPEATMTLAAEMTLAQDEGGNSGLGPWWAGLIIGFVLLIAVVVVVGTLLALAARIGAQARAAVPVLEQTRVATVPLAELARTNQTLLSIAGGAVTARQALGG